MVKENRGNYMRFDRWRNTLMKVAVSILVGMSPCLAYAHSEPIDSVSSIFGNAEPIYSEKAFAADTIPASHLMMSAFYSESMGPRVMMASMSLTQTSGLTYSYMFRPGEASPLLWKGGGLFGRGYPTDYPGLMRFDNASLGVLQNVGDFTVYAGGIANRYGNYWGGVHTQFGVEASMAYQLAPGVTANAYGIYYFGQPPHMPNGMPMSPAMTGFYSRSSFGANLDFQIDEHWGVEAGAQMVRHTGTGRFEAEPVATPYYKINNKVKIGLPVGQILYHIIRNR